MSLFATILAHLLFAYTVLGEPPLGILFYRRLNRRLETDPSARISYYRLLLFWEWSWVVLIALIWIAAPLPAGALGLQIPNTLALYLIVAFVLTVALTTLLMARNPSTRAMTREMMQQAAALLPSTPEERPWYAAVAITAGICEELLYRGFMIFYLTKLVPGLPPFGPYLLSALIFGLAHAYQGRKGIIQTGLAGLSFGIVYAFGGSLLPVMILHALSDLRVLWLWRPSPPGARREPAQS